MGRLFFFLYSELTQAFLMEGDGRTLHKDFR